MPKIKRWTGDRYIEEETGTTDKPDSASVVALEEKHEKAMRAMTSGAKPKVSDEEPPPGTVSHIAWERRQKAKEQGQKKALGGM